MWGAGSTLPRERHHDDGGDDVLFVISQPTKHNDAAFMLLAASNASDMNLPGFPASVPECFVKGRPFWGV